VDLSDLENNRFLSAAFQSVHLGGSNDMSNVKIREEKVFKQLTGGDSIQAENKGERGFTFRYKGILWFLANQLPLFGGDKGEHVYNRWIVFPCEHSIPPEKQIKDLCDRMFEERDSFCIKALQALQEAISNNYTFSIPESCKLAGVEYQRKNSVVRSFLEECCEALNRDKPPKGQTTGKFWAAFKEWCRDGNYYLPGKSEFRRELAAIAGVDEKELDIHTKDGNYYPYMLTEQYIKDEYPLGISAL
jgi:phage/plasmid-associated DNA primase